MPKIPGASARPSRTLQSLDRFTPDGITALAVVGLVLTDAINKARLVVNDDLSFPMFESVRNVICTTYLLQDALHGDASKLPAALASFLDAAEACHE